MRRSTSFRLAASAAALSVIVGAGAYGTYSAFTDTTDNTGNTFAAGTIDITDDDAGTSMFTPWKSSVRIAPLRVVTADVHTARPALPREAS